LLLEEKEKEEMAAETYDRIIKSLTPLEWEDALGILSDNHEFMEEHLDRDRKRNINNLIKFFTRIVEGDNISSIQPETKKNLSEALAHYRQAERLIKELPENINVLFISELKIKNNLSQKLILEDRNKETLAQDMYNRVIESLSVSEWEDARNLLFDNRQFMEDYLDKERKKGIEKLADFFFDVNEGDKIMEKDPWSIKNIDGAITLYKRAEQKATNLPDGINVVFITDMKIDQGLNQQSLIEQKAHEQHAGETYDRIMAGLVPDKWEESRDLLYSNRKQLEDYLDEDLIRNLRKLFAVFREIDRVDSIRNEQPETVKNLDIIIGVYEKQQFLKEQLEPEDSSNIEKLAGFFDYIEKGDRAGSERPENLKALENALDHYKTAARKAEDFSESIDVAFIPERKINEILNRKAILESRDKKLLAEETYERIKDSMTEQEWQAAQNLLYDNSGFLKEHLDDESITEIAKLISFFDSIREGDWLREEKPEDLKHIESALVHYKHAEQTSKSLQGNKLIEFFRVIEEGDRINHKATLETKQKETMAVKAFEKIMDGLSDQEYESARNLMYHNLEFMGKHLDYDRKLIISKLLDIFQDIEEGDRLLQEKPETLRNLKKALRHYNRADQKSEGLPEGIDISFATQTNKTH